MSDGKPIAALNPDETMYVVPWAMERAPGGQWWIRDRFTGHTRPGGTVCLRVQRRRDGLHAWEGDYFGARYDDFRPDGGPRGDGDGWAPVKVHGKPQLAEPMPTGDDFLEHCHNPELLSPDPETSWSDRVWGVILDPPRRAGRTRRRAHEMSLALHAFALALIPTLLGLLFFVGHSSLGSVLGVVGLVLAWVGTLLRCAAHLWPERPVAPPVDYEALARTFDQLGEPGLAQVQRDINDALSRPAEVDLEQLAIDVLRGKGTERGAVLAAEIERGRQRRGDR